MKKELVLRLMDKKYNTESGTPIDQKLPHLLLEVSLKPVFIQEPRFSISELPLELLFLTFLISLDPKVSFTQFSSLTELEEI